MSWLSDGGSRRPIVLVEDHLYHIGETLERIERSMPRALPLLTVVCLDRPGPDTTRSIHSWAERWPDTRFAAAVEESPLPRLRRLGGDDFEHSHALARTLASMLRPGGLLLQDIQLETLAFIPRDRWWESIYLATSVRGMFPDQPPTCRFLSNKRGYEATFGSDLLEAGFDPRDVLDKNALAKLLAPTLSSFLERSMPWTLERPGQLDTVVGLGEWARGEVETLDLVLWDGGSDEVALGGQGVRPPARGPRIELKAGSPEIETWRRLFADRLEEGDGVPVLEVGERTAPDLAGRAEITNCAARHIHGLRSRLRASDAIRTVEHCYRLDPRLRIARVTPSA